jgi:DNA-binding XRE family transcriptional regulator
MNTHETIEKNGKRFILVPEADYKTLLTREDADDIAAYEAAKQRDERTYPSEIVERMIEGDNPLKVMREWRGLTQQQLADKSGVERAMIGRIETGKGKGSVSGIKAMAEALDVDMEVIV